MARLLWCSRERWPSAGRTRWTYNKLSGTYACCGRPKGTIQLFLDLPSDIFWFPGAQGWREWRWSCRSLCCFCGPPGACGTSSGGFRGDGAPGARDETLSVLTPNTTGQRTEGFAPLLAIDFPNPYSGASMLRGISFFGALYLLPESRLVRIGLVVVLSGLARSRIDPASHWASDAVGGALLGVEALL